MNLGGYIEACAENLVASAWHPVDGAPAVEEYLGANVAPYPTLPTLGWGQSRIRVLPTPDRCAGFGQAPLDAA
jgi:hypothetical protein